MSEIDFDSFVVDSGRRLLLREGVPVPLSPKAFRLLETLIAQRPNAVSKQDLHDAIWPGSFVSEATLASLVSDLRTALNDTAQAPMYIRTVHGFGYAFCRDFASRPVTSGFIECGANRIALTSGENIIGRDPHVAIFIDDSTVSRHHATITLTGDRATLTDLGSKNGTFILDKRIVAADLDDGAEFHVGGVRMVFRRRHFGTSTTTLDRAGE